MAPVRFLLAWLILALILHAIIPDSLGWLANVLSFVLALGVSGGVLLPRKKQLEGAASSGSLELNDTGLVAAYGGTVCTLAWDDIDRIDRIAYPSSTRSNNTSIGGSIVSAAATAGNRVTAAKPLAVIGKGTWIGTDGTLEGQKLMKEAHQQIGKHNSGDPLVPIWFMDYDVEEGTLIEFIRERRPDLAVAE